MQNRCENQSQQNNLRKLLVRDNNGGSKELVLPIGLDIDRPKRDRTCFTAEQLFGLEEEFSRAHYLVGRDRTLLAQRLRLSETQIKVWFQNRRTKHKRRRPIKDNKEQLSNSPENKHFFGATKDSPSSLTQQNSYCQLETVPACFSRRTFKETSLYDLTKHAINDVMDNQMTSQHPTTVSYHKTEIRADNTCIPLNNMYPYDTSSSSLLNFPLPSSQFGMPELFGGSPHNSLVSSLIHQSGTPPSCSLYPNNFFINSGMF